MSIELPEALIVGNQMKECLIGKQIESFHLQNYERMQKIGFLNRDVNAFNHLLEGKIITVYARGNTIRIALDNDMNLLIAPEYGGEIFYSEKKKGISKNYHFNVQFSDETFLTVRIKSMGCILALRNEELANSYMYKRDFLNGISPIEDEFTLEHFFEIVHSSNRNLKALLVGKTALLVGISNSAFQDIIYRAELYPKRKGSELEKQEIYALFEAIHNLINERIDLGGKYQFKDLYGNKGNYIPKMGPNMKGENCPICQTDIEKISFGGGQIFLCPKCQI